jgi:hypothetical protein
VTCAETRPVDVETGWQVGIGKEQEWIEADENSPAWLGLYPSETTREDSKSPFRLSRLYRKDRILTCSWHVKRVKTCNRQSTRQGGPLNASKQTSFCFKLLSIVLNL